MASPSAPSSSLSSSSASTFIFAPSLSISSESGVLFSVNGYSIFAARPGPRRRQQISDASSTSNDDEQDQDRSDATSSASSSTSTSTVVVEPPSSLAGRTRGSAEATGSLRRSGSAGGGDPLTSTLTARVSGFGYQTSHSATLRVVDPRSMLDQARTYVVQNLHFIVPFTTLLALILVRSGALHRMARFGLALRTPWTRYSGLVTRVLPSALRGSR